MESIYNFEEELSKYGLTTEKYEQLLQDCSNKVQKISDLEWQEICDKYGLDLHYDTVRKGVQPPLIGSAFVSEYYKWKESLTDNKDDDKYFKELQIQKQEIRKEKQKLFDERTALNKTLRENARLEEDLLKLENLIKETGKDSFQMIYGNINEISENDLVVCLSDLHLGLDVSNSFGTYNFNVAKQRLGKYLDEIIKIKEINHSENVYVLFAGDLINGEIHPTVQLENRENLTEQVQKASELLSSFVYELSLYFKNVYVNGVAGNHSRTSFKDSVLRGNRLDNIIPWYMKAKLSHIDCIKFIDGENIDSTIGYCEIRNKKYLIVHGDFDAFSEAGVSKLVLMVGYRPEGIFFGHLHHNSYDDIANIKIVRSGCFSGTSDDYTVSKRITGKPSQMVCVVDNNGIKACYPVDLS